jgi:hypothetical protein
MRIALPSQLALNPDMTQRCGHCLCGATRYAHDADAVKWQGLCHCADCRRATGAPVVGWFGIDDDRWTWTGQEPGRYASSPGTERTFCTTCGTPLTFASHRWPAETHFLAATLDDPTDYHPTFHVYTHAALPWARIDDGLKRFEGTAKG